jgi:thiamine pyrophosphate-dependent acetolactate synthase large subunit-like protein
MPLGDFLVAYLNRLGVTHIFGLPGDLVLGLFHRFGRDRGLEIVTFSHEPGVGFAADGYARSTRRVGVVCVTYGAGGHNIVNPIAAAYAELAQAWGGVGFRVDTREELRKVLRAAHEVTEFVLIECRVPENDLSPITRRFIRKSVSQSRKKA